MFLIQKMLSNHYSFTMNALHPIERKKPHPVLSFFAHFYAYGLVAVSFLPQFYLIYCSFRNTSKTGNMFKPGYSLMSYRQIFETMGDAVKNTIVICGSALVLIILLAVLIDLYVGSGEKCIAHGLQNHLLFAAAQI